MNVFSGYDQVPFAEECRDVTGPDTPLELLRQTTLPRGAPNSVGQFVRIMNSVLMDHISHAARPLLDDNETKGPKTRYNDETVHHAIGPIQRFVLEHIVALNQVRRDVEGAGLPSMERSFNFSV